MNKNLKDHGPKPFVVDIEKLTKDNTNYRTVIWTGKYMQMTVMAIPPGEDIGLEIHKDHDQFIRIEEGKGIVQMGDAEDNLTFQEKVEDDFAIIIPAGKWHNMVNTGKQPLKLYSIYSSIANGIPAYVSPDCENSFSDLLISPPILPDVASISPLIFTFLAVKLPKSSTIKLPFPKLKLPAVTFPRDVISLVYTPFASI